MKPDYTVILYSLPGFIILMIAESIELIRENRFGEGKKNMLSSVFIGLVAIIVSFTIKGIVLYCYTWVYSFRLFDLPKSAWVWVLCFFGDDFTFYWLHRASHHIRFLWASHSVHHSPQTFTLCTALCMPWTANITGNFLFWAWMPLIGISPAVIITMKSISALYQFWLHTERIKKMPRWFEALFNTPSHHRVHHSSEVEYLDKNHGAILIIWDRLFGTFCSETHKTTYGLTKNVDSLNPFVIAFYEWGNLVKDLATARSFGDCFNYLFNSPGWSNDGHSKTTRALRRAEGLTQTDTLADIALNSAKS